MYIDKQIISTILEHKQVHFDFYEHRNQLTLLIKKDILLDVMNELKNNPESSFDMCIDITAVDWLKKPNRFEVVYTLYSLPKKWYLIVKTPIEEHHPHCPSITSVWESANWYERETYDMYGIIFDNHPFLRRFYMTEDYKNPETGESIYPLRKDYPLMGIPESLPLPPYPEKYGYSVDK